MIKRLYIPFRVNLIMSLQPVSGRIVRLISKEKRPFDWLKLIQWMTASVSGLKFKLHARLNAPSVDRPGKILTPATEGAARELYVKINPIFPSNRINPRQFKIQVTGIIQCRNCKLKFPRRVNAHRISLRSRIHRILRAAKARWLRSGPIRSGGRSDLPRTDLDWVLDFIRFNFSFSTTGGEKQDKRQDKFLHDLGISVNIDRTTN